MTTSSDGADKHSTRAVINGFAQVGFVCGRPAAIDIPQLA